MVGRWSLPFSNKRVRSRTARWLYLRHRFRRQTTLSWQSFRNSVDLGDGSTSLNMTFVNDRGRACIADSLDVKHHLVSYPS